MPGLARSPEEAGQAGAGPFELEASGAAMAALRAAPVPDPAGLRDLQPAQPRVEFDVRPAVDDARVPGPTAFHGHRREAAPSFVPRAPALPAVPADGLSPSRLLV